MHRNKILDKFTKIQEQIVQIEELIDLVQMLSSFLEVLPCVRSNLNKIATQDTQTKNKRINSTSLINKQTVIKQLCNVVSVSKDKQYSLTLTI